MPLDPTLPTNLTTNSTGRISDTNTAYGIINKFYKALVGSTKTSSFTVAQSNSGEVIPIDSSSDVMVTVPSLQVGTCIEFVRLGTGGLTFNASGVNFVMPLDVIATARARGSSATLLWLSSTSVLVQGDLVRG